MIFNATLLRLDPPGGGPLGADVSVRCAVTPPTTEQARISVEAGWDAVAVAYIPLAEVPSPRPVTEGSALMQADGESVTTYRIAQVFQRLGSETLSHIQLFLSPTP